MVAEYDIARPDHCPGAGDVVRPGKVSSSCPQWMLTITISAPRLLGRPDRGDHALGIVAGTHARPVGGGEPATVWHHTPEAQNRHLPTVDVEEGRLTGLFVVLAHTDRGDAGRDQLGATVDERLGAEVAGVVVGQIGDLIPLKADQGGVSVEAAEVERGRGIPVGGVHSRLSR